MACQVVVPPQTSHLRCIRDREPCAGGRTWLGAAPPFEEGGEVEQNERSSAVGIRSSRSSTPPVEVVVAWGSSAVGIRSSRSSTPPVEVVVAWGSTAATVLLLGSKIAESAGKVSAEYEKKAWLVLAWVSTVAGNLTLLGSAANLIVSEQARLSPPHLKFDLSFWQHLLFGVPSTILVTAIGLAIIMLS